MLATKPFYCSMGCLGGCILGWCTGVWPLIVSMGVVLGAVHKVCIGPYPSCIVVPSTTVTMSLIMYPYELLACFAPISSVLVCVVLHPFL